MEKTVACTSARKCKANQAQSPLQSPLISRALVAHSAKLLALTYRSFGENVRSDVAKGYSSSPQYAHLRCQQLRSDMIPQRFCQGFSSSDPHPTYFFAVIFSFPRYLFLLPSSFPAHTASSGLCVSSDRGATATNLTPRYAAVVADVPALSS